MSKCLPVKHLLHTLHAEANLCDESMLPEPESWGDGERGVEACSWTFECIQITSGVSFNGHWGENGSWGEEDGVYFSMTAVSEYLL